MRSLLLATTSPGKLRELRALLVDLPVTALAPADLGLRLEVAEEGDTFLANARTKALAWAAAAGLPALADDSGLEVDALGGEPGVASARWHPGSDEDRVRALLERLRDVPPEARGARYRAVVVLARPGEDDSAWAQGRVEGRIATAARGTGGFGYDPIFLVEDGAHGVSYDGRRTMAELGAAEKNALSHRARALRALGPALRALAEENGPF